MTTTAKSIEKQLMESEVLQNIHELQVTDNSSGCGLIFHIQLKSSAFHKLSLLQRQRLVHKALGDTMSKLHALTLECDVFERGPVSAAMIESKLRASADLTPLASMEVKECSGGPNSSFEVTIVSETFEGLSRVQQQRMVHKALGEILEKVNELSFVIRTPRQLLQEERTSNS